jgi:iduronate 2-sulfatase
LIVRAPGLAPAGGRADGLVEVTDLYPTLLEFLGFPGPAHLEGTSFLPLLQQPGATWKKAVFTQSPQQAGGRAFMGYSITTPTHRLTRWVDRAEPTRGIAVELYDRRNDPAETRNLAAEPEAGETRERLLKQLAAGWSALPPPSVVPNVTQ